ncbi:O-antigen ligase domain-containing protein [Euhalothece natronophila Z-M001]|uniref:O-antigen ligase domain-containing protein n=1 Tax=Euhalothece natronophila Z-M001 TaxID=522448 RepID=A0A5B8NKS5_9CHRO|nr:O-antigen ligase domain-containing protein [Euhalothece natronophila]QDZ39111.1 O-antigen ligase domain-containing protein [Euhalothece natronophila Z-M001]
MSLSQKTLTPLQQIILRFIPQPATAWILIFGLFFFTAVGIFVGAGNLLRVVFPLGSLAVGLFLFQKCPLMYISFTLWLYFLTPFIRRLIDYHSSWVNPSTVLLAPPLVALIPLATVIQYLPQMNRRGGLPFLLALGGISYAFLIGLVRGFPPIVIRDLIDWLTPLSFAIYLWINWRSYPDYRQTIQRTFVWGVLVMGIYGVIQYLVAPEWDRLWLIESGMTSSAGDPEPFGMRIWSTMNSPGPFAATMMTGLILLFSSSSIIRLPAAGFGYLSFLLAIVRAAWGAWLLALIVFASSLKLRLQLRLIMTITVLALIVIPLATLEPFSERISDRMETFSNLEEDASAQDRQTLYEGHLNEALFNYQGTGIGVAFTLDERGQPIPITIDSGVIAIFNTLGWFGAIPYFGGIILLVGKMFQAYKEIAFDEFLACCRSLSFAFLFLLFAANSLVGFSGLIFWSFSAIILAGNKYYKNLYLYED